jgi:hypothetical protein
LADARRRVADSKTLKQSHVDALVNATLEYVKVHCGGRKRESTPVWSGSLQI